MIVNIYVEQRVAVLTVPILLTRTRNDGCCIPVCTDGFDMNLAGGMLKFEQPRWFDGNGVVLVRNV